MRRRGTLTTEQVIELLDSLGRQITPATWRGYVHRQQAPLPVRKLRDRIPLWDEDEVTLWQTDRDAWKTTYAKVRHRKPKATPRAEAQADPT